MIHEKPSRLCLRTKFIDHEKYLEAIIKIRGKDPLITKEKARAIIFKKGVEEVLKDEPKQEIDSPQED